jgi:hypothetical protein
MIYGLNFNGTHLPEQSKKFAARLKVNKTTGNVYAVGSDKGCDYILSGMCNNLLEVNRMINQADNGHRQIRTTERLINKVSWYGIYCG